MTTTLERFVKVRPRLLLNLGKALEVAGIEKAEAEAALKELQRVQEACFQQRPAVAQSEVEAIIDAAKTKPQAVIVQAKLPANDQHMLEVSKFPIGIWLEFQSQGEQTIRCTLAAKIDTIEKYVFVNGQGVKVIEKSKTGLAR